MEYELVWTAEARSTVEQLAVTWMKSIRRQGTNCLCKWIEVYL